MSVDELANYQPAKDLLKDKVIAVTGAGDGIGRAMALQYAAYGATVILIGRTLAKLEKVYDEIEAAGGPQPAIIPFNFESTAEHEYEEVGTVIEENFGRLDGLLLNAGVLGQRTPLANYNPSAWQTVMQVNVNSQFLLLKTLLPLLLAAEHGRIIFTSSGVGRKGRAYWGAYAVSKFATEGLMETLADELEDSTVSVCAINPGATRTGMRAQAYPAEDPQTLAPPEALAPTYLFAMGPEAKTVHGQSLNAQG